MERSLKTYRFVHDRLTIQVENMGVTASAHPYSEGSSRHMYGEVELLDMTPELLHELITGLTNILTKWQAEKVEEEKVAEECQTNST